MSGNEQLLWMLAEHLCLTAAPGIAAALLVARRGVRSVPVLLAIALAASGLVAIGAFWAYYASPKLGQAWAYIALFGSIGAVVWTWREGGVDRQLLRQLRTPLLLWALGSFFVTFLGFLHGGTDQGISMSATRFSGQLPTDNDIPQFFSNWFFANGHHGTPPEYPGEWLMSDRPPLQIGYVLSQRTYSWDPETNLHYQVLGVVIQQLWIVGMWAVLIAARLRPLTRALAICAALVSDIAILHGFFVWPKLIAASFLLAALALVLSPAWERLRRDPKGAVLLACLCGLAMLAHGSSVFGVVPLLVFAFFRGLPSWRWLGIAALVGIALLAPWNAYQKYGDPPGNRLLKWQLGGQLDVDSRGTLEAIEDGYEEEGVGGVLHNKKENFVAMAGGTQAVDEIDDAIGEISQDRFSTAIGILREPRFFSLLPFLGILLIGPLAMVYAAVRRLRRDEEDWRFALECFLFVAIASVFWGLLLFGTPDSRAVIHVGSLAVPLLALVGCVAGLRSIYPRLAAAVVVLNGIGVLLLYTPSLTPPAGTSYSLFAGFVAALSLAGFCLLAFHDAAASPATEPAIRGGNRRGLETAS